MEKIFHDGFNLVARERERLRERVNQIEMHQCRGEDVLQTNRKIFLKNEKNRSD